MLTPREQGDFGELSAMHWLAWQGASVALPVGNSRHWDVMAELDGRAIRVQVKTTRSLFVLVGDGRRWFIPSDRIGGGTGLRLGGPKYAEFEVDAGEPIPGCVVEEDASTIAS